MTLSTKQMNRGYRILIADDHIMMAEGLKRLLESEFASIEIVRNGQELVQAATISKPHIVLTDIGMPLLNGIEATRRLRKVSTATRVIIVTMHDQPEYLAQAFQAGASGYVLKQCAFTELKIAIAQVLNGYVYWTPLLQHEAITVAMTARANPHNLLTSRQREVLQLVAEGRTAKEIANILNLSVKTAVFHKATIMDKLAIRTTAELTRYAFEHGIIAGRPERRALLMPSASSPRERQRAAGMAG